AVDNDAGFREVALQSINLVVPQRWYVAVVLRTQTFQYRVTRMDDKRPTTCRRQHVHKSVHEIIVLVVVYTQPMFDRDRDADCIAHRLYAIRNEARLGHQTGTKGATLDALGGASAIQIDFVVTPLLAEACAMHELRRVASTELQCNRMFVGMESQMA